MITEKLYTRKEACEILRVKNPCTLWRWEKRDPTYLPITWIGNRPMYKESDILKLL